MFKLKLAIGGKSVSGSVSQPTAGSSSESSSSNPLASGLQKLGEAVSPKAAIIEPAAAPSPAPPPDITSSITLGGGGAFGLQQKNLTIGGLSLSKALPALGMTERHGLSPSLLFPPPKPLERTPLFGGSASSAVRIPNSNSIVNAPSSAAATAAAVARANALATAEKNKKRNKKKKEKKQEAAAAAAASSSDSSSAAVKVGKQEVKGKPAPIIVGSPNGVLSTPSTPSTTPSTPSSISSNELESFHMNGSNGQASPNRKAKKAKKQKAEREIDSALLRSGLTAGDLRVSLRQYSEELITELCSQLQLNEKRRNYFVSSLPSHVMNGWMQRHNPTFNSLLAAPTPTSSIASSASSPTTTPPPSNVAVSVGSTAAPPSSVATTITPPPTLSAPSPISGAAAVAS